MSRRTSTVDSRLPGSRAPSRTVYEPAWVKPGVQGKVPVSGSNVAPAGNPLGAKNVTESLSGSLAARVNCSAVPSRPDCGTIGVTTGGWFTLATLMVIACDVERLPSVAVKVVV